MPSTRHVSRKQPSPKTSTGQNQFTFPRDKHLLVATPSHIYAWDSTGVHIVFASSKSGIVAAREAKDGSGVLAVADKHTVVLHDTKRGQERSWGLNADDDKVRHLEYTADAKLLFLSTNLTADIQSYSTEQSKLLAPSRSHASPPVALAISGTGHLLVSASDKPPATYLRDLKQNSEPTLIESRASETGVSKIAFHPERPNIFLLAFRDGTVASFDATKISRNRKGPYANQEAVNAGEMSRMPRLHRTTLQTPNTPSITDAAFLPGYKTRAITTGADGRCRLIDFADGGIVVRTWHAKAPVASVSILSRKSEVNLRKQSASNPSHTMGWPTSTDNLIAIGRADGKVHIYDSLGLLLDHRGFSEDGESIISVEWAKGMSPAAISSSIITKGMDGLIKNEVSEAPTDHATNSVQPPPKSKVRSETTFEHVGLPTALRKPKRPATPADPQPLRRFTIHPDEIEECTVRHNPASKPAEPVFGDQKQYLDLFSPVKPPDKAEQKLPVQRLTSPPRTRPRVSPGTFIKSPEATPAGQYNSISRPRNLALFPSTDSSSTTPQPLSRPSVGTAKLPSIRHGTKITFKPTSQRRVRRSSLYRIEKPSDNVNAKVLADLRKLSSDHLTYRRHGTLAPFAHSKPANVEQPELNAKRRTSCLLRRHKDHVETDLNSETALEIYEHAHRKRHWPEDSNQDTSIDGDIWLTSDSDDDTTRQHRRGRHRHERPPARQTSRSRVDSKGTISTLAQAPAGLKLESQTKRPVMDGSTDDDMETARSHISPSGVFSPSSSEVRDLFPRTSSLSPRKSKQARKSDRAAPGTKARPLAEVTLNTLSTSHAKSPWARARAQKNRKAQQPTNTEQAINRNTTKSHKQPHCDICVPTKSRVIELEAEVARLNGEVLALKAILRRNGVQPTLLVR